MLPGIKERIRPLSAPEDTSPHAAAVRSVRMTGLIVFLYVFSHSFYLVGSFRNALGNSPQEAVVRAFALLHGIAALGLLAGSLFLLLKRRYGLLLVRAGAVMLALVDATGAVVFWKGPGPDLFSSLAVLSQPVYPIF